MKDISKPRTLFEFHGKLFQTVGYATEKVVFIQPVRESDYKQCECGRPLPDQTEDHVLTAPNLQSHIGVVYIPDDEKGAPHA